MVKSKQQTVAAPAALVQYSDVLGEIKMKIAALQVRENELRDLYVSAGPGQYPGQLYVTAVSDSQRTTVDWKAIAEQRGYSHQLLSAHSSTVAIRTVRCTLRKGSSL